MKVKVNDTVLVITGEDKGKQGKVIRTLKKEGKVVVEGVNIVKKHSKPRTTNDKGGIFEIEAPIHVSNVKVITEAQAKEIKKAEKAQEKKEKVEAKDEKKETKKTSKTASRKASK